MNQQVVGKTDSAFNSPLTFVRKGGQEASESEVLKYCRGILEFIGFRAQAAGRAWAPGLTFGLEVQLRKPGGNYFVSLILSLFFC